ncbi:MAG: DUF262 domain-containing protein [Roseibium sp.]
MDARLKFTDEQAETSFADTVSGDSVLTIPLFQRPYRWTKQNLDWFWQDIEEIREGAAQSEFMGVVVAVQRGVRAGRPIPFEIVDGQQRLSTIYLFVTAAVEAIARSGETTAAANLVGTYLLVRRMADNPINTKLIPSYADRRQFKNIWDRVFSIPGFSTHPEIQSNPPRPPTASGAENGRMTAQYNRMRTLLTRELQERGLDEMHELIELVVGRLSFVNISLKDPTVAPKIFERLNARAEPITIADLVRNEVFSRIDDEPEEAHRIFEQHWEPFAARFSSPNSNDLLEKFLFPYGLVFDHNITKRELFVSLRDRWAAMLGPIDIIDDMSRFADTYMALESGQQFNHFDGMVMDALNRIHRLNKPSSTYSFILQLIDAHRYDEVSMESVIAILKVIEDFLFRRAICGIEPTGLHAVFKGMWAELTQSWEEAGEKVPLEPSAVIAYISGKPTISWPNDEDFELAIRTGDLYHRKANKFALSELEIASVGETPQDNFQIEHVLPQTPTESWVQEFGERWESVVNSWANLLPVTEKMNPQISRSDYNVKRKAFVGSVFATTRNFAEQIDEWNPDQLAARADKISRWAVARWPTNRQL